MLTTSERVNLASRGYDCIDDEGAVLSIKWSFMGFGWGEGGFNVV